jgi:HK97 family phage major capsid protein
MKKSDELKLERTAKLEAQRTLVAKAKTENRDMSAEENTAFDVAQDALTTLNVSIARHIKIEENELAMATAGATRLAGEGVGNGEQREKDQIAKRFSFFRAIRLAHPGQKMDGVEKEVHEMGLAENREAKVASEEAGFALPVSMLSRASQQTVSQDAGAFGGALVQNAAPVIKDSLRPTLFLEELGANFLTGLSGGDIPLLVASDFVMEFIAEGAALTPQKKGIAGPSLTPKRAGGAVDISNRLLLQASNDVEAMIMNQLRSAFSQLLESAAINGAGGVAPTGLLSYTGVLDSAQTSSAAATYALCLELEALIEANDSTGVALGFLMNPKLKAFLKQLKKDAGSGIFVFADGMLDGTKSISTSLVPALNGGANQPLIYGDFSQMTIGQWGAVNIKVNPYSADLSDSVRLTLNTHSDMQIANPKSFARSKFLTA